MFQIRRMCFIKLVNNSQSYHKSSVHLCHQEFVEQSQHFLTSMFYTVTVVQKSF